MTQIDHLSNLKKKIDKELEIFFTSKILDIRNKKEPSEFLYASKDLRDFVLSSGKRIRPILFYFGYIIAGGKEKNKILKTSILLEFIHTFFLIHDDIIDQSNFRHGNLSIHYKYEKKYGDIFKNKNLQQFGISMAIIIGDLALNYGYEILHNSDFPSDLKNKAFNELSQIVSNTLKGQIFDLILEIGSSYEIDKILTANEYKTAKYTIEGPLHLGAILAGADEYFLESLSKFAIPVGIAFQIQDDIIGIFGDEKKTGRPVGLDIREGKKTLLISKAMEKTDEKQRNILNNVLGNKNISFEEINKIREIIIKTGSLEFSKTKARKLIDDAKKSLDDLDTPKENKKFLNDLANFIVGREY